MRAVGGPPGMIDNTGRRASGKIGKGHADGFKADAIHSAMRPLCDVRGDVDRPRVSCDECFL